MYIIMRDFNTSPSDRERNHTGAMTVALITENGSIQTIWLPDAMEGRYRFQDGINPEFPLYIESDGKQWIAYAEKGAFFHTASGLEQEVQPLTILLAATQTAKSAIRMKLFPEGMPFCIGSVNPGILLTVTVQMEPF